MNGKIVGTFSRYVGVQLLAYAFDMGTFLFATWLGSGPLVANVFGKLLAGGFAFFAHRRLTFGVHRQPGAAGQLLRYAALLALNVPLSSAVLALLLQWIEQPVLAKFIADVLCVGITFVLSRQLVFRPKPANLPVEP